jgi:hypothetical protein
VGVSGILSSCIRGFGADLQLQQETQVSSLVETGDMGLHSICGWELRVPLELWREISLPLELRWGSWAFSRVATMEKGLL